MWQPPLLFCCLQIVAFVGVLHFLHFLHPHQRTATTTTTTNECMCVYVYVPRRGLSLEYIPPSVSMFWLPIWSISDGTRLHSLTIIAAYLHLIQHTHQHLTCTAPVILLLLLLKLNIGVSIIIAFLTFAIAIAARLCYRTLSNQTVLSMPLNVTVHYHQLFVQFVNN